MAKKIDIPSSSLTPFPVNIFVLGDLVLDHAIFIRRKGTPFEAVGNEKVSEVRTRITMAGGAANCARALAALGSGHTFLWGITGKSPWGEFSDVLSRSHIYDCAVIRGRVSFRGYHDQSITMNTITRLITVSEERHDHEHRFDDVGQVRLPESVRDIAIHELQQAHKKNRLDAVIINDLDMLAVEQYLVEPVSEFCLENEIPLFIDPKRTIDKYSNIQATAILPNLNEWCSLVGQPGKDVDWRSKINHPIGLKELATFSLEQLPKFTYHIIKCDRDGAVLIAPSAKQSEQFEVLHVPPHPTEISDLPHQLGTGDVMTAILASEYASSEIKEDCMQKLLDAFFVANRVVATYRQNPWHRMPLRRQVESIRTPSPQCRSAVLIIVPKRYLPKGDEIDLKRHESQIESLVSVDKGFRRVLNELLTFFQENWSAQPLPSAFLTARGGDGKTEVCKGISTVLKPGIGYIQIGTREKEKVSTQKKFWEYVKSKKGEFGVDQLLVAVDEAFETISFLRVRKQGVTLLQKAEGLGVRFLFIDAGFDKCRSLLSGSQFESRIELFQLPEIGRRPYDIPLIFAAGCVKNAEMIAGANLQCSELALLAVIEKILTTPIERQSSRNIFGWGKQAVKKASKRGQKDIEIRVEDLPSSLQKKCQAAKDEQRFYSIKM